MGWFFKSSTLSPPSTTTQDITESSLVESLPPSLQEVYLTHAHPHPAGRSIETGTSSSHTTTETALAATNCAEYQQLFVDCITKGTWREKLSGCDSQDKQSQRCIALQKLLFMELGWRYVQSEGDVQRLGDIADVLGEKHIVNFDGVLTKEMKNDAATERERLWR